MGRKENLIGGELRRLRERAGMSRDDVATRVNYAPSTIAAFESGERFPTSDLARRCDELFDTGGLLARIRLWELRSRSVPDWFRKWPVIEEQSNVIKAFGPLTVPGLLQTEPYARALLGDDGRVTARLNRQQILTGSRPPEMVALVEEGVLHRDVGGPTVMYEQLARLADPPPTVTVRVLPREADTHLGLDGPFVLATVDGHDHMYVETAARGFVLHEPELVSEGQNRWERLLIEALPGRQSRELISDVAEERWKRMN